MFLVRGRNSRGGKAFLSPRNESPEARGPPDLHEPQSRCADINSKTKTSVRFGSQGLWEAVKARSKEFPIGRFVATFPCMTSATFSKSRCMQIIPLMPSCCPRKGRGSISSSFQDMGVTAMERPFSAVSFPETPCIISLSSLACFVGIYWLHTVYALGRKYCFC